MSEEKFDPVTESMIFAIENSVVSFHSSDKPIQGFHSHIFRVTANQYLMCIQIPEISGNGVYIEFKLDIDLWREHSKKTNDSILGIKDYYSTHFRKSCDYERVASIIETVLLSSNL